MLGRDRHDPLFISRIDNSGILRSRALGASQRHTVKQDSAAIVALQTRMNALEIAYARLSERMQTVGAALSGMAPAIEPTAKAEAARVSKAQAQTGTAPSPSASAQSSSVKKPPESEQKPKAAATLPAGKGTKAKVRASVTQWFKPGEAVQLFQSILKKPMKFGDLFKRVVSGKRKSGLPPEEMGRFKWAVEAAVKKAVAAKALTRHDDGLIAAAAGAVAPASASDRGPKKKPKAKKRAIA